MDEIHIPKERVPKVLSLARSMQESSQRRELEERVVERLPSQYNGEGIPQDVMYEMGGLEGLSPEYVQRAMQLHSEDAQGTFEALREKGINPNIHLIKHWFKQLGGEYVESIVNFLNNGTNPKYPFSKRRAYSEHTGYSYRDYTLTFKEHGILNKLLPGKVSGKIDLSLGEFHNGRHKISKPSSFRVKSIAFTPMMLELFSGPLEELSEQNSYVSSHRVDYLPKKRHTLLWKTGDPY